MKTLAAFLILVMIWVVGLLAFADRIEISCSPERPP